MILFLGHEGKERRRARGRGRGREGGGERALVVHNLVVRDSLMGSYVGLKLDKLLSGLQSARYQICCCRVQSWAQTTAVAPAAVRALEGENCSSVQKLHVRT